MNFLKLLRKRGLALFLVLTMCLTWLPTTAMAASGYTPVTNVGIYPDGKPAYGAATAMGKVRESGQSLTMKVGQRASFLLGAPTNTLIGETCRHTIAVYNPSDYCDISLIDNSGQNLVGNPTYAAGNNNGTRVFDTIFEALKPGTSSDVRVCYYANFGIVFTNGANAAYVSCPRCGRSCLVYKDTTWYRYNDVFGITVNADYVLNYDTQGGSAVAPTTKTVSSTTATLKVTSIVPTREGYKFLGWAETEDATTAKYKAGDNVTLNWSEGYGSAANPVSKTLYAVWEKDTTYTVTYTDGVNGETVFPDQSYEGLKAGDKTPAFVGTPTRKGYTFMGWAPTVNPVVSADDADEDGEIIYTATWQKVKTYTVTYTDGVDGEEVFADQVYSDLEAGAATPAFKGTPTREGYTFKGWNPEVAATVIGNATYTAQWEETPPEPTYTVTYTDGVDGEEVFADQVYRGLKAGDDTPAFEGTPTREGYTFMGWTPEVADTVTGNATYTAQWEENRPDPSITVSKTNGGFILDKETGNATVNYTVTVTNTGECDVYGLRLTDTMDAPKVTAVDPVGGNAEVELTFKDWSVAPTSGSANDLTHVIQLLDRDATFEKGQTVTLTYTVEVVNANDEVAVEVGLNNTAKGASWSKLKEQEEQGQLMSVRTLSEDDDEPDVTASSSSTTGGTQPGSSVGGTLPRKYTVRYSWFGLPEGAGATLPEGGKYFVGTTVNVDTAYTDANTVTVDGNEYRFSGWDKSGTFAMPAEDVEITGTWKDTTPATYTVKYGWHLPAGAAEPDATLPGETTYPQGAIVSVDKTITGTVTVTDGMHTWKFTGWKATSTSNVGTIDAEGKFTMPANDVNLWAAWAVLTTPVAPASVKYMVEWLDETGSELKAAEFRSGDIGSTAAVTEADKADIIKDGITYKFNNANPDSATLKAIESNDDIVALKLYFTKLPPEPETITVTWVDGLTSELIGSKDIPVGTEVPESEYPSEPSHDGYEFTGWSVPVTGSDGNITITAAYRELPVDPNGPTYAELRELVTVNVVCDTTATHTDSLRSVQLKEGSYSLEKVDGTTYELTISPEHYTDAFAGEHSFVRIENATITLVFQPAENEVSGADMNDDVDNIAADDVSDIAADDTADSSDSVGEAAEAGETIELSAEAVSYAAPAGQWTVSGSGAVTIHVRCEAPVVVRTHTVTWLNWNGDVLERVTVDNSDLNPGYSRGTPTRPADGTYTYTFSGWSAPTVDANGNITYVAQYTPYWIPVWNPTTPVTPAPVTPVTPAPAPSTVNIPDNSTPLDDGITIDDNDVPLAGTIGLNNTDHFAYIIGYEDDTVKPLNNITRAEVATIFFRLMTDDYRNANWSTDNSFSDVAAGSWYNNAISTCANAGALNGYADGSFKPNASITRAEFAAIAARFLGDEYTDDGTGDFSDTANHWAAKEIRLAAKAGWVRGDGNMFRPNDKITRAEVMTIVNRMLDRIPNAEHMLDTMKKWNDNPVDAWYYEAVQEATNEHAYERDEDLGVVETWTEILPARDWKSLEASWAEANA